VLAFALLFLTNRRAAARDDTCGQTGLPLVVVAFTGEGWDPALARGILEHLRAGLAPAGFDVCHVDPSSRVVPVATVELRRKQGESVAATIEVRDGVTSKRIARDIDVGALPEDGRALGVGVAADELLRASWIELALEDAPKPKQPPPAAVRRTVERALTHRTKRPTEAGARASVEGYGGGLVLYGGDVAFRHWFEPSLGAELAAGLRRAPTHAGDNGDIRASALCLGASFLVEVMQRGPLELRFELGVGATEIEFRGDPAAGSSGDGGAELAVVARAGAAFSVDLTRSLVLSLRAGGGFPLRAVYARDHGDPAIGASGVEFYGAVGPAVAF
jgi:hypothetical protein